MFIQASLLVVGLVALSQSASSYYWYGQRVPVVEAADRIAVEFAPEKLQLLRQYVDKRGLVIQRQMEAQARALIVLEVPVRYRGKTLAELSHLEGFRAHLLAQDPRVGSGAAEFEEIIDRYIVVGFAADVLPEQVEKLASQMGYTVVWRYGRLANTYRLRVGSARRAIAVANQLVESGQVRYAEPDRWQSVQLRHRPDDTHYALQWHLNNSAQFASWPQMVAGADIRAEQAWELESGELSTIVAVADTGVDMRHPEFAAPGKLVYPLDVYDGDSDPTPPYSSDAHGTAGAGLVAASEDGSGVVGVCPGCALLPVRLGGAYQLWQISSFARVVDHVLEHGAQIISNSWGFGSGYYLPQIVYESLDAAAAAGVTVVFSAGNGGADMYLRDLASHPAVIAVGGSSDRDLHISYSDRGPALDVVAPTMESGDMGDALGPGIYSCDITGPGGYSSMDYYYCSGGDAVTEDYTCSFGGTSASCPIAAGAAALLVSHAEQGLSPEMVKWLLATTADKIGTLAYDSSGWNEEMGFGRINVHQALAKLDAGDLCTPVLEDCVDQQDNDCDLLVDGSDPDCGFVFPPPITLDRAGESCQQDCGEDLTCFATDGAANGVCSTLCEEECPGDLVCVSGSVGQVQVGYCSTPCAVEDCAAGMQCRDFDGTLVCQSDVTFCEALYCAAPYVCNPDDYMCALAPLGAPCGDVGDCAPGDSWDFTCLRDSFPEGYCSAVCYPEYEDMCGPKASCYGAIEPGICLARCASDAECRSGYRCATSDGLVDPQQGVCLPQCAAGCPSGISCNTAIDVCGGQRLVSQGSDAGAGDTGVVDGAEVSGEKKSKPPAKDPGCGCRSRGGVKSVGMTVVLVSLLLRVARRRDDSD